MAFRRLVRSVEDEHVGDEGRWCAVEVTSHPHGVCLVAVSGERRRSERQGDVDDQRLLAVVLVVARGACPRDEDVPGCGRTDELRLLGRGEVIG